MAAARNHQVLKNTIRFFSSRSGKEGLASGGISSDELDESDIFWPCSSPPRSAGPRPLWKNGSDKPVASSTVGSLPMSIPDWSRMLQRDRGAQSLVEELEDDEEDGVILPPHEMVWRRRAETFSMVEGIGRTLKGRDLSRVRNAVWARTGFQD